MSDNKLKIVPLGGLGEFGKNCTVLEYGDSIMVIDAGLMFPSDDMPGVDMVIPDFGYLVERKEQIRGIVVTHGHEDHIGALPYLLQKVSAPVYATPLTAGLIEGHLDGHGLANRVELHTVRANDLIDLDGFQVTPFHVNHSIPDSVGLAIRTPLGLVVHSGDFKIDHTPLDGALTDLALLARLCSEGVLLLMSDSTNAESAGYTASESRLVDTFQRVFSRAPGRIVVTTFASLISRIQLVIETAAQFGRKVAVAGRSMEENIGIAEKLGHIRFPADTRVPLSEIADLPDQRVCILATGSQGEPNAALARMAMGRYRHVHIREGDTVLLSSKMIPGNETQIHHNIDNLFRRGANVVYGAEAGLHVSGHGAQEELKLLLNLLRPRYFMPIHGAMRMLHIHARLAHELGYDREHVFLLDDGMNLELDEAGARQGEPLELQKVFVDGALVGDVGRTILRDRMALSQDGFVIVRISVDEYSGHLVERPEIISQGFVYVPESGDLLTAAEQAVITAVERHGGDFDATDELATLIKRRLEGFFYAETRRRPVIIPLVDEV